MDTKTILGHIKKYCDLKSLNQHNFSDTMRDLVNASLKGKVPPLKIACGTSKGVIIFMDEDFVVKIPFRGFQNAESVSGWDYCEREVEIYTAALLHGVADLLVKTEKIGTVKGYPIYIQERVTNIDDFRYWDKYNRSHTSDNAEIQATRLSNANTTGASGFRLHQVICMINAVGFRYTQRFMNFCVKIHTGRDWHQGNYGAKVGTGHIVFCDYTGFRC